jgi:prepilin-type processing-associated H-X9-DG protein
MPTLQLARMRAQQIQCASQLRQLHVALLMYANANHGWLPTWSGWHTYPDRMSPDDEPGLSWTEQLASCYVKPDHKAFTCPAYPTSQQFVTYFLASRWSDSIGQHSMKLTSVKMTSRFVLSGDMTNISLYLPPFGRNDHRLDDCDKDDAILPSLGFPYRQDGFWMHRGGNNVLFDDGHVAFFADFDPSAMTFSATEMKPWEDIAPQHQ